MEDESTQTPTLLPTDEVFSSFAVQEFITKNGVALSALGLAALSRYVLSGHTKILFGGDYNRSIVEHGLESFGAAMFMVSVLQLLSKRKCENFDSYDSAEAAGAKIMVLIYWSMYVIALFLWEVMQSSQFNRPVQWEQLIGSLSGMGLGWLATILVNTIIEEVKDTEGRRGAV